MDTVHKIVVRISDKNSMDPSETPLFQKMSGEEIESDFEVPHDRIYRLRDIQ